MIGLMRCAWRKCALDWIDRDYPHHGSPWSLPTGWRPQGATEAARFLTIQILRATPDDLAPLKMGVTRGRGIFIHWSVGLRELNIEARADATFEISATEASELIEQLHFEGVAIWRLHRLFCWLRASRLHSH